VVSHDGVLAVRSGFIGPKGSPVTESDAVEAARTKAPEQGPAAGILRDAEDVIGWADAEGLTARLIGGVAIYLRSSSRTRTALGRYYADFDLVVRRREARKLRALLEAHQYVPETIFNATHGESRLLYNHPSGDYHIDVFIDEFNMSHKLDFTRRLDVVPLTLPASDLLLTKMQVAQINPKDLSDAAMLLLDHAPSDRDGDAELAVGHVAETLARDWGLYTTVTDNLGLLAQAAATLPVTQDDRELVVNRIEQIIRAAEEAPKTTRWQIRSRVGRRVRWFELPEDIG
jgi:hypothetical protein